MYQEGYWYEQIPSLKIISAWQKEVVWKNGGGSGGDSLKPGKSEYPSSVILGHNGRKSVV